MTMISGYQSAGRGNMFITEDAYTENFQCPICASQARRRVDGATFVRHYACPVCGEFSMKIAVNDVLGTTETDVRVRAWVREQAEYGRTPPEITQKFLDTAVANLPRYSPLQKQVILLKAVERRTTYPGQPVKLNILTDYPLAWAANENEFRYLLKSVEERELVVNPNKTISGTAEVIITPQGWEHLEKEGLGAPFADQAFVAMSFKPEMDLVWEDGIKPAIEKAGYKPVRVDKEPHIDRIDAKIVSEIKNSRFLVADVTGQNPGVYFEGGYALGLGRPVIWTVRKNKLKKVHFDTRQYNHIVWATPEELKETLYDLISVVIGRLNRGKI